MSGLEPLSARLPCASSAFSLVISRLGARLAPRRMLFIPKGGTARVAGLVLTTATVINGVRRASIVKGGGSGPDSHRHV